jgi:hypothetical protein
MSLGYRGKTTNSRREVVATQAQAERETQWGEISGTVVSFDPTTQTASIQPNYKPKHNGEPIDMPQLEEVPVRFTRAGGFVITSPIKPGDKVTLRPQMRSSEEYHTGGEYTSKNDSRSFSLSDMEAFLDGGEPISEPISNFNASNMEIRSASGDFKIEMSEDGKFKIVGAQGNWFDLLTQVVELLAADTLQINYGSSAGTGHALEKQAQYSEIAGKLRSMAL